MIYKGGKLVKYIVLYSLKFASYFKYLSLDCLYELHKKTDAFDARLSDSNFCHFLGSGISDLLLHILYLYASIYYG